MFQKRVDSVDNGYLILVHWRLLFLKAVYCPSLMPVRKRLERKDGTTNFYISTVNISLMSVV